MRNNKVLPITLVENLSGRIPSPCENSLNAMKCVLKARLLLDDGRVEEAFGFLNRARAIEHQFPHAMIDLRRIALLYEKAALSAFEKGDDQKALRMVVLALEADPNAHASRELLDNIVTGKQIGRAHV